MKIKEITLNETYKVTQNNPQSGMELTAADGTRVILPPEKASAIQADPQDPNKFTMSPVAVASSDQQQQQPIGPQIGAEIELPPTEFAATEEFDNRDLVKNGNRHIGGIEGGDKTADFINDVVARTARGNVRESEELIAMLTIAGLR